MEPQQTEQKTGSKGGLLAGILAIVVLAGIVLATLKWTDNKNMAMTTPVADENNQPVATSTNTQTGTSKYKDGTYSADGSYLSPGGNDTVHVTLTLKNGVITDATVTSGAGDPTSAHYQSLFISGFKQYVVGVNIDALNVKKVSGSSLTSKGFNDAVSKIKLAAQA